MYESYPCSRCSYHDFLSRPGSRGFYLDPVENYGTDHFHSRESVPCSFARSVYVWCSRFFLRAYQEFLIAFVFSLLISCPAFAEDENYQFQYIGYEAMANQGMDVNQYLMDQYQEERNSEIAQILAEPLANNSLRSINNSDITEPYFYGFDLIPRDYNGYIIEFNYLGSIGSRMYSLLRQAYGQFSGFSPARNSTYWGYGTSDDPLLVLGLYEVVDSQYHEVFHVDQYVERPSDGTTQHYGFSADQAGFFYSVKLVFTWILDHIAEIITFILGNAFLSVSLLLFMCGAVISFYVRIRRS